MWKYLTGEYENLYMISDTGEVFSCRKNRLLSVSKINSGYLTVHLTNKNKEHKRVLIHRLVATVFLDNPNNLPQVNHIDEDKTNNNVSNLEWCSIQYNNIYGNRPNKYNETIKRTRKKIKCLNDNNVFDYPAQAARYYGFPVSRIYNVLSNRPHYNSISKEKLKFIYMEE